MLVLAGRLVLNSTKNVVQSVVNFWQLSHPNRFLFNKYLKYGKLAHGTATTAHSRRFISEKKRVTF